MEGQASRPMTREELVAEITRLKEIKAEEIGLSFPCECGYGRVTGVESIDSGTVLDCQVCGARWKVTLDKAKPEGEK